MVLGDDHAVYNLFYMVREGLGLDVVNTGEKTKMLGRTTSMWQDYGLFPFVLWLISGFLNSQLFTCTIGVIRKKHIK